MAFIQQSGGVGLVRDEFPRHIGRNNSEQDEWSNMSPEYYMPSDFDTLFEWVALKEMPPSADSTRRYEVVHTPVIFPSLSSGTPNLRRLTIRVLGVVGNCNLTHLGNWDRAERGCAKAIQFITLRAGVFQNQFETQVRALSDLRCMVYRCLGERAPYTEYRDGEIFFHRRVFKKVAGQWDHDTLPDLGGTDEARLASIASRWYTDQPATFARKLPDTSLKRCSSMIVNPGDFVDVTATIDIVTIGRNVRDRRTNVHFAFTRIFRLISAKDLAKIAGSPEQFSQRAAVPIIYEDRLPFEYTDAENGDLEIEYDVEHQ